MTQGLARRGHEVRALSRRAEEHPVDLETGAGLDEALDGCDVLVDASNGGPAEKAARSVLIEGGGRLLDAAGRAGISHVVGISIVGIEQVPLPYYRVKVEHEQLLEGSGLPYSIVRSSQFHTLIDFLFQSAARYRVLPGGKARLQPVAPRDVAEVIAGVAEGEPTGGRQTVVGPDVHQLGTLARSWRAINGVRAAVIPAPLPPKLGRPLKQGALTDPSPDHRGTQSWAAWLGESG